MSNHPALLLQDSIDTLEQLSAILAQELGSGAPPERLPPERRIRKEVLLSISVLLPKLHAARSLQRQAVCTPDFCPHCED
jgi:hypothetical protein